MNKVQIGKIEKLSSTVDEQKKELDRVGIEYQEIQLMLIEKEKAVERLREGLAIKLEGTGIDPILFEQLLDYKHKYLTLQQSFNYMQEELSILKEVESRQGVLQEEMERECSQLRQQYEDRVSENIRLHEGIEERDKQIERMKRRIDVHLIEIDNLTNDSSSVNQRTVKRFKDQVEEWEEEKTKIMEESMFNQREVARMALAVRDSDSRVQVLEQYLLKERHEKNKLKEELDSLRHQLDNAIPTSSPPQSAPTRDYAKFYSKALDRFDEKSRSHHRDRSTHNRDTSTANNPPNNNLDDNTGQKYRLRIESYSSSHEQKRVNDGGYSDDRKDGIGHGGRREDRGDNDNGNAQQYSHRSDNRRIISQQYPPSQQLDNTQKSIPSQISNNMEITQNTQSSRKPQHHTSSKYSRLDRLIENNDKLAREMKIHGIGMSNTK